MNLASRLAIKGIALKRRIADTLRNNEGSQTVEVVVIIAIIVVVAFFLIPGLKDGATQLLAKAVDKVMSIFDMT